MEKNYGTFGGFIGIVIPAIYQIVSGNELSLLFGMIVCAASGCLGALIGGRIKRSRKP